ncbi:hypothetical protein E2542_SST21052 [Spatholobus suberectus]|nr:hypothetical protein E2542_SST21052 [Spatholobus suberectus]
MSQWLEIGNNVAGKNVMALVWAILHRRNMWIFQGKWMEINHVLAKARSMVNKENIVVTDAGIARKISWSPSPPTRIKANFDVSIIKGNGMGFAMVFRDHEGKVIVAAMKAYSQCYELSLTKRLGNNLADCLAKLAFSYDDMSWPEDLPHQAIPLAISDVQAIAYFD